MEGVEEGVAVEVVRDSRIASIELDEEVPLVPADAGEALEEREDVDPDHRYLLPEEHSATPMAPALAEGTDNVAGDRQEEPRCHDG